MKEECKTRPPQCSLKCIKAFLSMPYGETNKERVYWGVLAAAIRETAKLIEDPQLEIHSAEEEVNALILKESVRNLIDKCDFTIAVMTGRNPNVFWEIGYTEAQKKPVVFLVDEEKEELSESPVLVAEALKCPYHLAGEVDPKSLLDDLSLRLKPFLEQAIKAVKATPRLPTLVSFSNRKECNLPKLVANATNRIYLITTNLGYFTDTAKFTVGNNQFAFDPPTKKGVDVKILTMDPESIIVKYRAEQLGLEYDVSGFREELRASARRFYQRYRRKPNVNIRLYGDLPLQITLIVDCVVVTSVLSRGSRGRTNLHFRLDIDTPGARESFEEHFHEVWAAPARHISSFKWATGSRQ